MSLLVVASLIFLRHGQAQNNVERRLMGRLPNVPLTQTGRQQAQYAAGYLADMNVSRIYASPIERTLQTADIVDRRCSLEVIPDKRLIEIDMAGYTGMGYSDLLKQHGNIFLKFYEGGPSFAATGVETFKSVRSRVTDMVGHVLKQHPGENVVLVTHMDPIKAMISTVLDLSYRNLYEIIIANGSINVFQVYEERITLGGINIMAPSRFGQMW